MNRPESKEERSLSRRRASSRGPRRLEGISDNFGKSQIRSNSKKRLNSNKKNVNWSFKQEPNNNTHNNMDDQMGGNFQSQKITNDKFAEFDNGNDHGEYYNLQSNHDYEFSAGDKIYEEENEQNSSTGKDESAKYSVFRQSGTSFQINDSNLNQEINLNRLNKNKLQRSSDTHEFYNTKGFLKRKPARDPEMFGNREDVSKEINTRVQNAMRRIEKKYRHKNNLNSQENKLLERYKEREKINNSVINNEVIKRRMNKSENYFSKTQSLAFNHNNNRQKNIDLFHHSDLMTDNVYSHNGYAYLDKLKNDEEKRQSKLNKDQINIKNKINDLQKDEKSQLRKTFYQALESKGKEKSNQNTNTLVGLKNSEIKTSQLSTNGNQFNENNEFNLMNSSSAFNKTKSQFRNTITGSNILSPINESQHQANKRYKKDDIKNVEDFIKINENRSSETARVYNRNFNTEAFESRENLFVIGKKFETVNADGNSMIRDDSRDTKLVSLKNSQVINQEINTNQKSSSKKNPKFKTKLNSLLSLKSKQSLSKVN